MHLEDQVVSLNLATRLKDLKCEQNSLFVWHYENDDCYGVRYVPFSPVDERVFKLYSAYSVSELLNMIPSWINIGEQYAPFNNFWLEIKKRSAKNIQYIASYVCDTMDGIEAANPLTQLRTSVKAHDEKLADCLAKILIGLIQKGFLNNDKLHG
jgi:hypothetical protein